MLRVFVVGATLLALLVACQAQGTAVPPDAFDTLYLPATVEERATQGALLAELGSSIDGIKLLLTKAPTFGDGFKNWRAVPDTHAGGPGLQVLATAVQAYLALWPGVYFVDPTTFPQWPVDTNKFHHDAVTYTPGTVTTYSGGTLYSALWYKLDNGPLEFVIPKFDAPNLWTLHFHEAYSSAITVLGAEYGSNVGGTYWLVAPGWAGKVPEGVQVIQSPTLEGFVLGRTYAQPDGQAAKDFNLGWTARVVPDFPAAAAVVPGSSYANAGLPPLYLPKEVRYAYPEDSPAVRNFENLEDPLLFWRVAGEVYRRNGAAHVVDPLRRLLPSLGLWREFGLVEGQLDELTQAALAIAPYYGARISAANWLSIGSPEHNYWFRHWNHGSYGSDYVTATTFQQYFPIVNRIQDAAYYYLFVDSDGEPLDAAYDYTIDFPEAPEIRDGAFWSLVATRNRLHAPGVTGPSGTGTTPTWSTLAADKYVKDDGSWPFRVSAAKPPANSKPADLGYNHVQAPDSGNYYITLRLYAPAKPAQEDSYTPPKVVRAGSASSASTTSGRRALRRA